MKIKYLGALLLIISIVFASCLSEGSVKNPTLDGIRFYTLNSENQFVEETSPVSGVNYTIGVETDADICSIWPGGVRNTVKKVGTQIDSVDINGNVVLSKSDCYSDYGLLKAQGLKTSLNTSIGWMATYTYGKPGEYELTVVLTNHGYDDSDYKQVAIPKKITIK